MEEAGALAPTVCVNRSESSCAQQPSSKQPALAATTILTLKMGTWLLRLTRFGPARPMGCHMSMQPCRDHHEQPGPPHPHLHAAQDEDLSLKDTSSHVLRQFGNFRITKLQLLVIFNQPDDPSTSETSKIGCPNTPSPRRQVNQLQIKGPGQASPRWASPSSRWLPRSRFARTGPVPVAIIAGLCYTVRLAVLVPLSRLCPASRQQMNGETGKRPNLTTGPKARDQRCSAYRRLPHLTYVVLGEYLHLVHCHAGYPILHISLDVLMYSGSHSTPEFLPSHLNHHNHKQTSVFPPLYTGIT